MKLYKKYQNRRKAILAVVFSLFFLGTAQATGIQDDLQAVEKAGMQRMLVLRMLKDYAMIGMNLTFGNPSEDLKKTIEKYEAQQLLLKNYANDKAIKSSIQKSDALWTSIKKTLNATPAEDKAIALQGSIASLRKAAHDTTLLFVKKSGNRLGVNVNFAGRLKAVSQKIAALYVLKAWGIKAPTLDKAMDAAMSTLKTSHETLDQDKNNTPEAKKLLKNIKKSLMLFEFKRKAGAKFAPSLISKKADGVLNDATILASIYVASVAK